MQFVTVHYFVHAWYKFSEIYAKDDTSLSNRTSSGQLPVSATLHKKSIENFWRLTFLIDTIIRCPNVV